MVLDETITLKKLEVFLAYMNLNNMAKVSELFGQSPVSVHRALHSLEEVLQCPLFKREGRNLIPLPCAYTFAEYANRSVAECKAGIRKIQDAVGYNGSRLNIGTNYSLTLRCIPKLLTGIKMRRPHLEIELTMDSNQQLLKGLFDGKLDAIIVGTVDEIVDPALISIPLFYDEMYLAAPKNSPFAGREKVDLIDLRHENFVTLTEGFATAAYFDSCLARANFATNRVMRVRDIFSLINLVSGGIGYSLLPGRVSEFSPRIDLLPLDKKYAAQQQVTLLLPRVRERDPNLLAVAAECRMYSRAFVRLNKAAEVMEQVPSLTLP